LRSAASAAARVEEAAFEFGEFFLVRLVRQLVGGQVIVGKQLVHAVDLALRQLGAGRAVEDDGHFLRPV
jgi:hypothetical protein